MWAVLCVGSTLVSSLPLSGIHFSPFFKLRRISPFSHSNRRAGLHPPQCARGEGPAEHLRPGLPSRGGGQSGEKPGPGHFTHQRQRGSERQLAQHCRQLSHQDLLLVTLQSQAQENPVDPSSTADTKQTTWFFSRLSGCKYSLFPLPLCVKA